MVVAVSTQANEMTQETRDGQVGVAPREPETGEQGRLSLGRKLGFAVGDYACNLYWQSVSLFLLFYYTDAVGLSAAIAGLIYMVASIFDGAIDPFMGAIS